MLFLFAYYNVLMDEIYLCMDYSDDALPLMTVLPEGFIWLDHNLVPDLNIGEAYVAIAFAGRLHYNVLILIASLLVVLYRF